MEPYVIWKQVTVCSVDARAMLFRLQQTQSLSGQSSIQSILPGVGALLPYPGARQEKSPEILGFVPLCDSFILSFLCEG
jgi:hypothetical protein